MKTILVPTDFSEHAMSALKVAGQIAKRIKAAIHLVFVCNLPSSEHEENEYYKKFCEQVRAQSEEKILELSHFEFLKGIDVRTEIVTTMHMWEIASTRKFGHFDLIVIGAYGASGFNKILIGSNTEKVVRLADAPVLTVKNEIRDFNIKRIVFASNFFEESYRVFEKIKVFADIYRSHVFLLKVITPREFEPTPMSLELMDRFALRFKLSNYSMNIYNSQDIESGIIEFSNEKDVDVISLETHGRTGFSHLINGSITEDIVKYESRPILSVKIPPLSERASKYMSFRENYENWGKE